MEFSWINNIVTVLTDGGGALAFLGFLVFSFSKWKTLVDEDRKKFKEQLEADRKARKEELAVYTTNIEKQIATGRENTQRQINELKEITQAMRDILLERNKHSTPK